MQLSLLEKVNNKIMNEWERYKYISERMNNRRRKGTRPPKQERDKVITFSMDVIALYPSLDQTEAASVVAEEIIYSGVVYEGADVQLAAVYLAIVLSKERQAKEGIAGIMLLRKNRGR